MKGIASSKAIALAGLMVVAAFAACKKDEESPSAGCMSANGTLVIKNRNSQSIEVLVDGVSYGFVASGNSVSASVAAGVPHILQTKYGNGTTACSTAQPVVNSCETMSLQCPG